MQKLDFINSLETIVDKLQSVAITNQFKNGFAKPGEAYAYNKITPLLFQSKSNYDQLKNDSKYSAILSSLSAQTVYSEDNLAHLTAILTSFAANVIIANPKAVALYDFHNTLAATLKLSKEVLTSPVFDSSFENSIDNGVLIFQILIESDGLSTEKYIKIFSALQELIKTISKIYDETEYNPEIVLLDSGSDTNVGIKSGIETAKSLFLIFKEIWDFVTNFKYYKASQKNKALLDSLSVRAEIKKKVDEKIITEEEGKEYMHLIKTRTDDLIGMKVLPKIIVMETNQIENKKLLEEFEGLKLIVGGLNNQDE